MTGYGRILLLGLLFAPLACGDDEPTAEETLRSTLDDYADSLNEQATVLCDCWDEAMFESRGTCQEANGEILPAKRRCYDDAFERDVEASQSYLDCVAPLQEEYNTCIADKLDCMNIQTSVDPCGQDYNTGRNNCIDLPGTIERALEDC